MTREELVEAVAKDVSAAVHIKGSPCAMCYGVANRILAAHAPAIIRLAVESSHPDALPYRPTVPDANGWMRECVHSDAYKQDLGDALVQAWQRGKTT